jgi:predicted DCC family thiol-disulfide oxidoreductase YuxK
VNLLTRQPAPGTRVYYDGDCPLCRRSVRFILARESSPRCLRFAPLGGETFHARIPETLRRQLPDSLVVETPDGRVLTRSDAVVELLGRLGPRGRAAARVLRALPRPVRDAVYALVALCRRPTRRPGDVCAALPRDLRDRLDP